jgi:hypothetical protein
MTGSIFLFNRLIEDGGKVRQFVSVFGGGKQDVGPSSGVRTRSHLQRVGGVARRADDRHVQFLSPLSRGLAHATYSQGSQP